jgi:hypothetical protein
MSPERVSRVEQVLIGAAGAVLGAMVINLFGINLIKQLGSGLTGTSENQANITRSASKAIVPPAQMRSLNATQWLNSFLKASEGPSLENLEPFFDGTVSPYYRTPNARWDLIAKDKTYYFNRFPHIEYVLEGVPRQVERTDDSAILAFAYQYTNIRKDGVVVRGDSYATVRLHFVDNQWKIAGIWERTSKDSTN